MNPKAINGLTVNRQLSMPHRPSLAARFLFTGVKLSVDCHSHQTSPVKGRTENYKQAGTSASLPLNASAHVVISMSRGSRSALDLAQTRASRPKNLGRAVAARRDA